MTTARLDPAANQFYTRSNRRPRRSGQHNRIVGDFFWILVICILIPSCTHVPDSAIQPYPDATLPPPTSAQETIVATPSPVVSPSNVPTHTPISCLASDGMIEVHEIRHPDLVSPLRVRVYLPPCYEQDTYATYPTLILLHGLLATDIQWDELGIEEQADQLIQAGDSPPFIMLMPWIRNSQDSYDAVVNALIPYANVQWRLSGDRDYWAIGGISRGAGQALQIGLLHPERFGAIGLHSPAILHSPELLLSWYLSIEPADQPAIWFDIGEADSLFESAMVLLDQFHQAGIQVVSHINPGEHTGDYWMEHLPTYLDWYLSFWLPAPGSAP